MTICFATYNPSKLSRYKKLLSGFEINLISLSECNISEKASEPYQTSSENALHKASQYASMSNLPTIAVDEEMRTNFLPENLQPGVYVRRLGQDLHREPTDQEVIQHWLQLIKQHPHPNQEFYWDFSIALFIPQSKKTKVITVTQIDEIATYTSNKWNIGYPMSTFMSPKGYGYIPYSDLDPKLKAKIEQKNFKPFLKVFPNWLDYIYNL